MLVTNVNEGVTITSLGGVESAVVSVAENQTAVTTVSASDLDDDTVTTRSRAGPTQLLSRSNPGRAR